MEGGLNLLECFFFRCVASPEIPGYRGVASVTPDGRRLQATTCLQSARWGRLFSGVVGCFSTPGGADCGVEPSRYPCHD